MLYAEVASAVLLPDTAATWTVSRTLRLVGPAAAQLPATGADSMAATTCMHRMAGGADRHDQLGGQSARGTSAPRTRIMIPQTPCLGAEQSKVQAAGGRGDMEWSSGTHVPEPCSPRQPLN